MNDNLSDDLRDYLVEQVDRVQRLIIDRGEHKYLLIELQVYEEILNYIDDYD